MNRPEYRDAIARAKFWKSLMFRGRTCGDWPPFAHFGVPQSVIRTSMPRCCAFRTSSSMSSNL